MTLCYTEREEALRCTCPKSVPTAPHSKRARTTSAGRRLQWLCISGLSDSLLQDRLLRVVKLRPEDGRENARGEEEAEQQPQQTPQIATVAQLTCVNEKIS